MITAAVAFTLLAQLAPEVPVAAPLLPNSPQWEFGARTAAGPHRILTAYTSYTTLVTASLDPATGEVETRRQPPTPGLFDDLIAAGDHFLLLSGDQTQVRIHALDVHGQLLTISGASIPALWRASGAAIGDVALIVANGNGLLVDSNAHPVQAVPLPLHGAMRYLRPKVAASRDAWLVLRADDEGLFATIVSARGVAGLSVRLGDVTAGVLSFDRFAAASDGSSFAVAWMEGDNVRVAHVNADGTATPPVTAVTAANIEEVALTWIAADAEYAVVYGTNAYVPSSSGEVHAKFLSRDAVPQDVPFVIMPNGHRKSGPAVTSGGFVVWEDQLPCSAGSDIFGAFIGGGLLLLSPGIPDQSQPAAGSGAIAWTERSDTSRVRMAMDGMQLFAPFEGVTTQGSPALATSGDDVFTAWTERRDDCSNVVAVATMHDFNHSSVIGGNADLATAPSIAFNGVDYAVAWQGGGRMWISRASRQGKPISAPVAVTSTETPQPYGSFLSVTPALLWTGADYLLVRERLIFYYVPLHYVPPITEVRVQRLSADFAPAGADRLLATGVTPAAAWNGSEAFIVWLEGTTLKGMRLDGSPLTLAESVANTIAPSISWTGTEYIVTAGPAVLRVSREGTVINTFQLPSDTTRSVVAGSTIAYERPAAAESRRVVVTSIPPPRRRTAAH